MILHIVGEQNHLSIIKRIEKRQNKNPLIIGIKYLIP